MTQTATMPRLIPDSMNEPLERDIVRIPEHCREGLLNYLRYGQPPGQFLLAILSNDLAGACARADEPNRERLFYYVYILANHAPMAAWGSRENVNAWIERGMVERRKWMTEGQ